MQYFVKIFILYSISQYNVESKAINKGLNVRKGFQFQLIPFKHFSFLIENLTPFGKFEMKHSLEKRDTIGEPSIANEIPVAIEEKKETVVVTSGVEHAVETSLPVAAPRPDVVPFVIELAPKPVEVPLAPIPQGPPLVGPQPVPQGPPVVGPQPVPQGPPVIGPQPVPPGPSNIPVFYTDISQIPLYNFAYPNPVPVEVPPLPIEPIKPVPVPEVPVPPVPPVVPIEPIPIVPVQPKPVQVPIHPVPILDVPLKPVPVGEVVKPEPVVPVSPPLIPLPPLPPPGETPVVVPPPLPNYLIKGSRLIIFFGSKMLQMLTQFIDGRSFNEFALPPLPPLGKKK